jgi:hypothetical protein
MVIDETRHFRGGDRIEFSRDKKQLVGAVLTYRFRAVDGVEEQMLNVMTDGGEGIANVPASGCKLVGRNEPPASAPAAAEKPVDLVAVACKALTTRGATLVAVGELKALATDYLALRSALANAAAADRSPPYRRGENRVDGTAPPVDGRWLTPRELGDAVLEGKVPHS